MKEQDLDPIFKEPRRVQPKYGVVCCNLHFRSYYPSDLEFTGHYIRQVAYAAGIPCSGLVTLPTKTERWCVPKSHFIHKKSQEVFERKSHKRLLQLKDVHPTTLKHFYAFIKEHCPVSVGFRIQTYEYVDVDDVIKSLKRVRLPDVTPKPKILADAILKEMDKNPSANLYDVGIRLYKEIFKVKTLPSLDFLPKPKNKNKDKKADA